MPEERVIRRPVLRYFGGKWMLAPWVLSFFPRHEMYIEPYGGAASVLMRKERSKIEILNDLDSEVVNVFRVLRDETQAKELKRLLELTPFSREEFQKSYEKAPDPPPERARKMICLSLMGIGADAVSGRPSGFRSKAMDKRIPSLDWLNYPKEIEKFTARLAGVTIENQDAEKLMKSHDCPEALFYLDPPYVPLTRKRERRKNYRHEMTAADHESMIDTILNLKGMVVLSGYDSKSYERLGWRKYETESLADGAAKRTECVWLNPQAERFQSQQELAL